MADLKNFIAVIDYGLGNVRSVAKAVEASGAQSLITGDAEKIRGASGIVLPGVGAFAKGMDNLRAGKLIEPLRAGIKSGRPFLGICLGLQLIFSESEEHGPVGGLNIINGPVKKFTGEMKIPHMGWNTVKKAKAQSRMFEGIKDGAYFYFVHSYFVAPKDEDAAAAYTDYGGNFTSAIEIDNLWACQFHPEKSGEDGLKIMDNFVKLCSGKE